MADSSITSKSLEQLEREITCGVCQEHYTEPKILPCLHYYCKKCVLDMAQKARPSKSFPCPECRNKATLPEEGVDGLKTAFFVNRLKSTLSSVKITHGQVEVQCETCLEVYNEIAEAFCRQCAAFICAECVKSHKRIRQYSKHEISSLDDLKQGKCKPVEKKEDLPDKCEDHDEPKVIYCYDCDALICRDCIMKDHKEHNFEFCKKSARHTKGELSQELEPLKLLKAEILHAAELVQATKQEVEDQGLSVAKEIKMAFSELHQILNEREKELLQEAETKVGKKVEKLSEQEKMLTHASVEIQGVVDYTEQCLSLCTDVEIMGLQAETKTKIRRETEEHSKMSLEPAEEADVGVAVGLADDLKQLCQDKAKIIPAIDFQKSTVSLQIPQSVQVEDNLELSLQLGLVLKNNKPTIRPRPVTAVIKSKYSGSTSNCEVTKNTANSYSIRYEVADRGRHEVVMMVDGQEVPGSPFLFVASLSPTELGQPIKIWNQISNVYAITTNSTGEILVTEECGDIFKFYKEGNRQTLVKKFSHGLDSLECIAVDSDDNIYCTDGESSKIMKCDKNGGNVQVHDIEQEKGEGHMGVVIVGEEVLACAAGAHGTVLVYDRNLQYVRKIQHNGGGEFYDISADSQHNLYVADHTNNSIHVFSIDGTHLHSFNADHHGEEDDDDDEKEEEDDDDHHGEERVCGDEDKKEEEDDDDDHHGEEDDDDDEKEEEDDDDHHGEERVCGDEDKKEDDDDDDYHGEERVSGPYSVHVFQQHVYIGNYSDNISVFTTDGTHVITFGSHGSEVGQLNDPLSITVGEDGLVYVAEYGNNRIQCFES